MRLEPFLMNPVLVERPWGGHGLAVYGKDLPGDARIGESWEVADLPDGVAEGVADPRSRVASGPMEGLALAEVIERSRDAFLGPVAPTHDGRFPLLVKLLDAREALSVQVHPNASFVSSQPSTRLKTESWYVLQAAGDASIYLDFDRSVTPFDVETTIGSADIVGLLRKVSTRAGSFHHVPAGLVHALGPGVMVAEVQTPSDTTFRLYDWSEEYGRAPRLLHTEEALASLLYQPEDAVDLGPMNGFGERELVSTPHYWIREHRLDGTPVPIVLDRGPKVILLVEGEAAIGGLSLLPGSTAVVPSAATDNVVIPDGPAVVLEVGFPA